MKINNIILIHCNLYVWLLGSIIVQLLLQIEQ